MIITKNNEIEAIVDRHYSIQCTQCHRESNITAISIPRFELLRRFQPEFIGIVYQCDACLVPTFVKFKVTKYDVGNFKIHYDDDGPIFIDRAIEAFEYEYLPGRVRQDFQEGTLCYSVAAFNAFSSMCRRTIQSMSANLGAKGKDRVKNQLDELKKLGVVDDDTLEILNQIIIAGHDGAHPHLPDIEQDRAAILLQLMKDILYQIYIRKAKLEEVARLRQDQIDSTRS